MQLKKINKYDHTKIIIGTIKYIFNIYIEAIRKFNIIKLDRVKQNYN